MSLEFDPAFNLVWSLAIALPIFFCIVPPLLIKELRMFTREREDILKILKILKILSTITYFSFSKQRPFT